MGRGLTHSLHHKTHFFLSTQVKFFLNCLMVIQLPPLLLTAVKPIMTALEDVIVQQCLVSSLQKSVSNVAFMTGVINVNNDNFLNSLDTFCQENLEKFPQFKCSKLLLSLLLFCGVSKGKIANKLTYFLSPKRVQCFALQVLHMGFMCAIHVLLIQEDEFKKPILFHYGDMTRTILSITQGFLHFHNPFITILISLIFLKLDFQYIISNTKFYGFIF